MRTKTVWTLILVVFALYLPVVYLLDATYDPNDGGPPASAGTRIRITPPYSSMTPIAVTVRDRKGVFEHDVSQLELWEDDHKLGPGGSTVNEIVSLGHGRFLLEPGRGHGDWLTWSSSDNTDPMTNGRTYWVVNPN